MINRQFTKIYGLVCPLAKKIKYVGRTNLINLQDRLNAHISSSLRNNKSKKEKWIYNLANKGLAPSIVLLEEVFTTFANLCETKWYYLCAKNKLHNSIKPINNTVFFDKVEWTDLAIKMLGVLPDSDIAKILNCNRKSVVYKRNSLGIKASYNKKNMKPPPNNGGWNKIKLPPECIKQLGKKPDYILAKEYNVSKPVIRRERKNRNIVSYAAKTGNNGKFKCK